MRKLTKAEEEIIQVLWELESAFLKELMEALPEPKPSQSTVSTILRILEKKGFIGHKSYGKSFQYYPLVTKEVYAQEYFGNYLDNYFGGSFKKMLSFFVKREDLDLHTLNELLEESSTTESTESK